MLCCFFGFCNSKTAHMPFVRKHCRWDPQQTYTSISEIKMYSSHQMRKIILNLNVKGHGLVDSKAIEGEVPIWPT